MCLFFFPVGHLLGFNVSKDGITLDPLKVQAILELPIPHSLRQLQSLQGKANFLLRFILDYATNAHGFLRLLRFNISFVWDNYAQESFDAVKYALTSDPFIHQGDFDRDFILYISASTYSVVGVLIQEDENGIKHVIYYVSKNLVAPPVSYSHEEKLALVVMFSVQKLRHYIVMHSTKVMTNSNPMAFLLSRQIINWKYTHWIVILQEFDLEFFTPKSKKGLALTELISKLPTGTQYPLVSDDFPDEFFFSITTGDPWYGDILTYLQTQNFTIHIDCDSRQRIQHQAPRYLFISDDLYRCSVYTVLSCCLMHDEDEQVLNARHSGTCGGHLFGLATTQKIMCIGYFWPFVFGDFIEVVKYYSNFQHFTPKARAPIAPLHPVISVGTFCKWAIVGEVNPLYGHRRSH